MKKVLVIDDDGIARDALLVFLTRGGYEVVTASDGGNGLLVFKSSAPDLVILDREMPVMTGSEVLARIREENPRVPVIILTGYDAPEDAEKYMQDGATSFLSKGAGLSPVLDEVQRLIGASARPKQPAAPAPARAERAAPVKPEPVSADIIVADDEEAIRSVLARFLRSLGHSVVMAVNGREALTLAEKTRPDIVLLDIYMPEMNGMEALAEFRRRFPDTGVIMITGNDDEDLARESLQIGAFDYISKPVKLEALAAIIRARLIVQGKN